MVCYLMVEAAAIWFVGAPRFTVVHGGTGKAPGIAFPALGALVILTAVWFSVKDSATWSAAPILGLYWCALGLVTAVALSRTAQRVGTALAAELKIPSVAHVR